MSEREPDFEFDFFEETQTREGQAREKQSRGALGVEARAGDVGRSAPQRALRRCCD